MIKTKFPVVIDGIPSRYIDVLQFVYPTAQTHVYNLIKQFDSISSTKLSAVLFGSSVSTRFNTYTSDLDIAIVVRDCDYNTAVKSDIFSQLPYISDCDTDILFCKISDFKDPIQFPIYREVKDSGIIIYEGGVIHDRI